MPYIADRIHKAFSANAHAQGDCEAVVAAAERGNYGTLCEYASGSPIRPATADELVASLRAGAEGAVEIDGRSVFVAP